MSMYIRLSGSWISIFFNEFISFLIIIKLSKKKIYQYSLISVQTIITVKFEKLAVKMPDGIIYKHSYIAMIWKILDYNDTMIQY